MSDEPVEGRVLTEGWLVTIEWEMDMTGPMLFTAFTTQPPGQYFMETKERWPKARALVNVTPVELTDEQIETLL